MKTMKTLLMATATVLAIGVGSAMAQDGNGGTYPDWQSQRTLQAARNSAQNSPIPLTSQVQSGSSDVQSGSSDVEPGMSGANHTATFILEHHLYGGAAD
jgi:hypothetical protein